MRIEPRHTEVRLLVLRTLRQLTSISIVPDEICETAKFSPFGSPLRRYATPHMVAEWMRDEGIVRFFDRSGRLVHSINLWSSGTPLRAAA
jgi:hypothetical protein